MKKSALIVLGLGLLLGACNSTKPVATQENAALVEKPVFENGSLILGLKDGVTIEQVAREAGVQLQAVRQISNTEWLVHIVSSNQIARSLQGQVSAQATVNALAQVQVLAAGSIEYAQYNHYAYPTATPNDASYAQQWDLATIKMPEAWDITKGEGSPVVAVIDTGITSHNDLNAAILPGYDFVSDATNGADGNGRDADATDSANQKHGTHVAGTIGAVSNNGIGITGINWNAKIVPIRVLGKNGGTDVDIIDGMRWAAGLNVSGAPLNPNPAKVLNLSLGGGYSCSNSKAYQNAINEIVAKGVSIIVAAGNDNKDASAFTPASCPNVITVAATSPSNAKSSYSNYGATVEIAAPGDKILSTVDANGYAAYNGTSMATPHVAGLASLLYALKPSATQADILKALQSTAQPVNCSQGCGSGIINAPAAMKAITGTVVVNPGDTVAPTVSISSSSNNVTAAGSLTLSATASDNVAVSRVDFYDGATLLASDNSAPYSTAINLSSANNGTRSYSAKAVDAAGNVSSASVVSVVVNIANTGTTYPAWAAGVAYKIGDLVSYNGKNYKCIQPHTSLTGWEPSNVPALWSAVL